MNKLLTTAVFTCLYLLASAVNANDAQNQVLFVGDNHLSKAKSKILIESANKKGLNLTAMSARKFKTDHGLEKLCDYKMVLFQAVSEDAAAGMYGDYNTAFKACKNTSGLANGFTQFKELNKGVSSNQYKAMNVYLSNGIRSNFESLFAYISTYFFNNQQNYTDAIILPEDGFYHFDFDEKITGDISEFYTWLDQKGKEDNRVAVLFHRSAVEIEQTNLMDETLKALEKNGAQGFGVFLKARTVKNSLDW